MDTTGLPALYVGMHKQQLYVQESHSTADKLEQVFAMNIYNEKKQVQHNSYERVKRPLRISWKPSKGILFTQCVLVDPCKVLQTF